MNGFIIALQFLTRFSIKPCLVAKEDIPASTRFYPLVGLFIGVILSGTYILLSWSAIWSPLAIAVMVLIVEVLITGGLHLDGFMDTADGLGSYRSSDRMLAIMKDSRVGANAVVAVICLLLLKTVLIASISGVEAGLLLMLMPVAGRWVALFLCALHKHADPGTLGLGQSVLNGTGPRQMYFGLVTLVPLLLVSPLAVTYITGAGFLLTCGAVFFLLLVVTLTGAWFAAKAVTYLGGITGDIIGAAVEICQVVFLFVGGILFHFITI